MQTATAGTKYGRLALSSVPRSVSDWEAVRVFLVVARLGSIGLAANDLNISQYVVRRRLAALEDVLGFQLYIRRGQKITITAEGRRILAAAGKMDEACCELLKLREQALLDPTGDIHLAVTEGLGAFWVMPRLMDFRCSNPGVTVNVDCAMKPVNIVNHEADLAIQLARPKSNHVDAIKLGRLHLMLFASPAYLKLYGTPKTTGDLARHRLLVQADDQRRWRELYDRLFPGVLSTDVVALRNNISSAHYWSVVRGGGIGILPTYAHVVDRSLLVPLDVDVREPLDIWLTYRPESKRVARVARLIDWLVDAFSPEKYPWFRDEFIHPNDLMAAYKGDPLWRA